MKKAIVVILALVALVFAGCTKKEYGSESTDAVIHRYMEALAAKDRDEGNLLMPEGLNIGLGPLWASYDDPAYIVSWYHWKIDTLNVDDFVPDDGELEESFESRYGRDFEEVGSTDVTCCYEFDEEEGCYSLTLVTCKYMGRYYIMRVIDNGEAVCAADDIGDYGSFTVEDAACSDGTYTAHIQEQNEMIRIIIADTDNRSVYSFEPVRKSDFWGICWENGTYNLWIQSGDVGVVCYSFEDGEWALDAEAVRPDYIVSKYD